MWTQNLWKSGCLAAASLTVIAGPLDKGRIASDAKWFVHIDVEGLRNSTLGDYLVKELVNPNLDKLDQLSKANLTMNVSNITSITAYGPSFDKAAEGVLMVSTTADPRKDLDTVAGMFLAASGTNAPFTMLEQDPYPLYTFGKSIYFAPAGHTLFVAKSREQLDNAREVLLGKAESLKKNSNFKDLRDAPKSFLFAGVADGFAGNMGMPPQAQILREAKGGHLSIGERDKNLFLSLAFQGKDDMATTRLQQVLQGLVALASLTQQDDDITQLAAGIKIASEGQSVQVNLEFPVDKTIQKIKDKSGESHRPHPTKAKVKTKHKHTAPAEDDDSPPADAPDKAKSDK